MKTILKGVLLALGLSNASAFAYEKITCSSDERSSDGILVEVHIVKIPDDSYSIRRRILSSRMSGKAIDTTKTIASMPCLSDTDVTSIACSNPSEKAGLFKTEETGGTHYRFYMNVDGNPDHTEEYAFDSDECLFE